MNFECTNPTNGFLLTSPTKVDLQTNPDGRVLYYFEGNFFGYTQYKVVVDNISVEKHRFNQYAQGINCVKGARYKCTKKDLLPSKWVKIKSGLLSQLGNIILGKGVSMPPNLRERSYLFVPPTAAKLAALTSIAATSNAEDRVPNI